MYNCKNCSKKVDFFDAQSYMCNFCGCLNEPILSLNSFNVFGIKPSFDIDLNHLEDVYLHLVTVLHPDNHQEQDRELADLHSAILNSSYENLKYPASRAEVLFKDLFSEEIALDSVFSQSKSNEYFLQAFEKLDSVTNAREYKDIKAEIDKRLEDILYNLSTSFKAKNKKHIREYYSYLKYTNRLIKAANIKNRELNEHS